jgi:hypothetical protein
LNWPVSNNLTVDLVIVPEHYEVQVSPELMAQCKLTKKYHTL